MLATLDIFDRILKYTELISLKEAFTIQPGYSVIRVRAGQFRNTSTHHKLCMIKGEKKN